MNHGPQQICKMQDSDRIPMIFWVFQRQIKLIMSNMILACYSKDHYAKGYKR